MLQPQLLAILRELISFFEFCSLCIHLSDRNYVCLKKITIKIKKLKFLKSVKYNIIFKIILIGYCCNFSPSKHLRSLSSRGIRPEIQEQVPETFCSDQQVVHYMGYNHQHVMRIRIVLSVLQTTYEIHYMDKVTLT
jgi:hypothetical protein